MRYNRVLIKLSGEALGKENGRELDSNKLDKISEQIIETVKSGVEVSIVVGAGNFWRGKYR
jgi:uridylate kinase